MMKAVLLAIALIGASAMSVSAATIEVTFGDRAYALKVAKVCSQKYVSKGGYQLPVLRNSVDGTLIVGTQPFPYKCARKMAGGGGGGNTTIQQGTHTGQTAEEVAEDLGLPEGSVGTIDPGPVVDHEGVVDTNDGDSNDEAAAVTAEGAKQSDAQPDAGTTGDTTTKGNDGVEIF